MSDLIYFDNAATSWPKPEKVYKAAEKFLREEGANPGRSGHTMALAAERTIEKARKLICTFLGADNHRRVIFTLNCSDALNIAIHGIVKTGEHVITTALEHNSVMRPLKELELRKQIEISLVKPGLKGYVNPADIKKEIKKNTSLIILNHVSNVTGAVQPVEEVALIASARGIPLLVDAAQSAGVLDINLIEQKIPLCALPGHKGLLGPTGTGVLYASEEVEIDSFRQGGSGSDSASARQPEEYPFHLEAGTPNTAGIAALAEGVKYVSKNIDSIRKKERELTGFLLSELKKIEGVKIYGPESSEERTAVVSINHNSWSPDDLGAVLDENFNIAVRTGLHCAPGVHKNMGTFPEGALRISCGPFNTIEECEKLVRALREVS
ncbi:MAG: aminotransferase class V-fold PLP-dependent enzyme [Elusimicrobiota bacterium]